MQLLDESVRLGAGIAVDNEVRLVSGSSDLAAHEWTNANILRSGERAEMRYGVHYDGHEEHSAASDEHGSHRA